MLGIAAPYIQADRYGQQIREALQRGLNRKVEIGQVHFNLFTGPGFTVENVVIYDDPSAGIEPFAHMLELEARVGLSSLFTGRLEFSVLRFVSPSVNIVKPDAGAWNVVRLLQGAKSARSLPEIQVSDGRIYLKNGDTKSAFYISTADITVTPQKRFFVCPVLGRARAHGPCVPGHRAVYRQRNDLPKARSTSILNWKRAR